MRIVTKNYKGIDNTQDNIDYLARKQTKTRQQQLEDIARSVVTRTTGASPLPISNKKLTEEEAKNILNQKVSKFTDGNWINTQALDDGFDWYDPLAMLGATTADITLDVLHGGLNTIEGMADTGQYLLADLAEWGFGNKNTVANAMNPGEKNWANNLASDIRANADYASYDALFGKSQNPEDNIFGNWQEGLEKYSLSGDKLDQVTSSIGQMGVYGLTGTGFTGVPGGTVPTNALVTFTSSYGNAKSQAKRNGASEEDAVKKGLVSGIAETISENMFNAIPGFESAGWFDDILGKVMKKKTGKVATTLFEPLEEGFEEIVSNLLDVTGTYIVNYLEGGNWEYGMQGMSGNYLQDMWNTLKSPETWEAFFSAALSTSIVHLGNNAITNQQYNNAINKYAKENNVSVEQAKADFKEVLGAAVEDYSTDEMSSKEKYELEQGLNKQLIKDVKGGLNLSDAALNVERARMEKQANLPIIRNTFEESLVNHGFDPNNEVWKSISKTLEKRGITGIVDEQYFNDNSENALIINDGNGNRIMAFNPNADTNTIIQANTVHELVHDLIASENSKRKLLRIKAGEEIKDSDIIKYFEKIDGYAEARADLEKTYSTIKDANGNLMYDPKSEEFGKMIDEEVVAKVLEKNLGTQETINRLVHENRNLAQRIYDWIMNKIKNRGGVIRNEELYWRNIQNRFVKAFNMEYNNSTTEANTRLSKTRSDDLFNQMIDRVGSDYEGNLVVNDSANYYIISKDSNNNYEKIKSIPINDKNIQLIKNIEKEYENVKRGESINKNIEGIESGFRNSNSNNTNIEREESWSEFIDRVLKEQQSETINNTNNIGQNNENSRELDNSSFNLPLDSKKYSKESKAFDEFLNKNLKDTGTTGDLMAIHNLNEEKLKGMLELGGTAYPSIAITTPSTISHEGYGDISVLFDKSTIDPANKLNKVYSRDAYTPRFPTIEYKLDSNVKRQIRETIGDYDYRNAKPGDEYISDAYGIIDNIEDNINRSGLDRTLEDVKNNDAMKYVYLKNTNPDFKVETKNETYSQKYNNETLQRFIDNYDGEYELNDIPSSEVEKYVSKMVDAYKQQLETEKGNENDLSQKLIDVRLDKLRNEFYEKNNFLMAAYKLQKYGTEKQVLDKQATREKMNSMINQEEYNQWVDKLFENIIEKKGLRNNKDYYTSSGNPRSFEQLHDEYTLNNVVKIMSELNDTGEEGGFFYGISEIAGNASQRFNTIEDIKANKNLLTTVGDEEYHQILDNMQERLSEIEENVMERGQNNSDNYFIARDNMASVIADAARIFGEGKKIDANKIQKMLKEYGFEVTTEESQKILDMFSEMRNLPTQYFEAKPQRAVGLDEVQAIVIPNTASESLRKQLNDAGFDFVEYDPNVEGDRQRVINKFDNLKFNKNSPEWNAFVNKHTTTKGTRTKLGDTKLPMTEINLPIDNEFANYLDTKFQDLQKQIDEIKPKNQEVNLPTEKNTTKKEKTTMPLIKKDDVLKISTDISDEINKTGDFNLRKWTETSTESDILKGEVFIEDLDPGKITYEVQSNKKSLEEANRRLETYGYEKSLQDVKGLLRSDKLPTASEVALMQRMIQEAAKRGDIETVQDLIMDTAIVGTDLGQATQALSIIQKLTPEGQLKLYTKLVQRAKARGEKSFKNVEITPEMVQNILEAYKPDGTYDQNDLNARVETFKQDIAKQMKTTTMEKLDAWRYLAMLGNPKTHIRNMISNVAMKGTLKVKNAVARTLETILPVKERTKTWKNATPEIKQYAKQTAIEMKDIIQGKAKYNEKSQLEAEKQIFKSKALEKVRTANSNALEFEDWLFSKSAFIKTFQEYLTANNIRTKEDIRNNPKLVQKAKNYAVEQAEIATFRQYSKIASMIGKIERSNKGAKFIIGATLPFKKTPINVAKTGLNYSPLGLIKSMTYDTYRLVKGDINASQYIDNLSQGMTGSSLTLLGYALAKSGFLSGSGDDDKEGKYDSQLGNSQYSINIGGKSYSISWLSPVAMPLLVGANAYEQLEEQKDWDMNVISDTLAKTLDPLNEMSFLQGLTNALQSYGSGMDKLKGSLESIAQNYIGQFFPTLFSQIASVTDDKKRSTKASNNSSYKFGEQTLRSIMYKLPGARQQLEVATDVWGNEKLQSDNIVERAFESFIAPYSKTEHISTDLDNELKKVYNETGENKVLPTVPYGYIKYKDETYKMSASEFTEFKKDYGQTANKMLNNLINTQTYQNASYEEKADMIDEIYEYAREKAKEKYFKSIDKTYESKKLDSYKKIEYITSYDKYIGYKGQIDEIKKKYKSTDDMTSKQKTAMNKKRKEEVQKYINTLPLNRQQKLMLQKFAGNYSVKDYKKELQNYINSLKISKADKESLDKELFG